MDVLVQLEEAPANSLLLAHVNSVPSPLGSERTSRDVVTLYAEPSPESVALALAAAMESRRDVDGEGADAMRHLAISPERGAVGDAAWRDDLTGQLMSEDVDIPLAMLHETATRLLHDCGHLIRAMAAGLAMPDWPEGMRRAINFTFAPAMLAPAVGAAAGDGFLDSLREADGAGYDFYGD